MNLSLNSWMKQWDSTDSYLDCALNCYKSAITAIRTNLVSSDPAVKRQISGRLDRLAVTIDRRTNQETLALTPMRLDEILSEHRTAEEAVYQEEQTELRRTLTAIEELVRTVSERAAERSEQLSEVLQSLEAALFEGDLSKTHRLLQEQIRKLRTCLLTISEDRESTETALRDNLDSLRKQAHSAAPQDEQSASRTFELNTVLNTYMTTYTLFSLALFKVDDMAQFASDWSPEARAQLFSAMEKRLAESAGSFGRIHNWSEGEFVMIMRSTLARAMDESSKIKNALSLPYQVELPHGLAQIQLEVSAGAVEYVPGEDAASLLGRAELAAFRDREPLLESCETAGRPEVVA